LESPARHFHEQIRILLDRVIAEESGAIKRVGQFLAEVIANDHLIYVFGTGGHSYIAAEEMSFRAGGLIPVYPILDPGVSNALGGRRSSAIERLPGYAQAILNTHPITPDDAFIIVNAYGINACTIDAALWAKERGIRTIGITSPAFSRNTPPDHPARHPSRRNLFELVDYVLDNKMPERDAVLQFPGLRAWASPTSTILNAFVIQAMVGETVQALLDMGQTPPVAISSNLPGGDEANRPFKRRYESRIRF
jgi:uncharacterized phosphosugar-binding protein